MILVEGLRPDADSVLDLDLLGRAAAEPAALGRLRGRIVDSATGAALAGADIMLITSGLHGQSNAAGEFTIERTALLVGLDDGFRQPPDLGGAHGITPRRAGPEVSINPW